MTNYGKIKSYDSYNGVGTIAPEESGDVLSFSKADLQQMEQEPKVDQRFGYDTKQDDGGKTRAVNLQIQQGQREQAENQRG